MWLQKEFKFTAQCRGFHLVTDKITSSLPEIKTINVGILHLFIKHSSASLTILY
jgi:thiamine phosphate synthase YjbQ (UPF0047 family)